MEQKKKYVKLENIKIHFTPCMDTEMISKEYIQRTSTRHFSTILFVYLWTLFTCLHHILSAPVRASSSARSLPKIPAWPLTWTHSTWRSERVNSHFSNGLCKVIASFRTGRLCIIRIQKLRSTTTTNDVCFPSSKLPSKSLI